jgi:probable HAF family extracellular repeat protein
MKLLNRRGSDRYGKLSLVLGLLVLLFGRTAVAQTTYNITDLGTLGGTFGCAMGINDKNWVEFMDNLPGDEQLHAGLWAAGLKIDFGTLGGPSLNSNIWYAGVNSRGQAAGFSETSELLGENFCGFGTGHQCLPFIWQNGVMAALPTLGGKNGMATVINNRGQVVGTAEKTSTNPSCSSPSAPPVLWEKGQPRELPTHRGDLDGIAMSINTGGQAVGTSGNWCTSLNHALLWQNGTAMDLPSLGGEQYSIPYAINDSGKAVGVSDLAGDTAAHAVLWQSGIAMDLGALPEDSYSEADGINRQGQVVGGSCNDYGCSAFLWSNGTMTDLNSLIASGPALYLYFAHAINSSGEIVGMAVWNDSEFHAFLATPVNLDTAGGNVTPTPGSSRARPAVILSENVRSFLQKRLSFGRFGPSARVH